MAAGMEKLTRLAVVIAAFTVCVFLDTTMAFADARLCRQLEAQLAGLSPGGGGARHKKYDKAVAAQRAALQQARGQARGCSFSLFGRGGDRCNRLNRTIDRMERNLSALEGKRSQSAGNGGSKRQRNRLLASLDANGCRNKATAQHQARRSIEKIDRRGTLFDRIFNGGIRQLDELDEETPRSVRRVATPSEDWQQPPLGTYRTLCVRTCDGYYFPISPSSSMRDFERDQQNCEAMCPGTEAQIYYQDTDDENAETMVSTVTGQPYAQLPAAFLYRQGETPRPAQCGCNPAKNFSITAGNPPSNWTTIDVETDSNASTEGSITTLGREPPSSTVEAQAPPTTLPPPGERKVRVVGPMFLPDPEGAIDLQAPAQKQVQ